MVSVSVCQSFETAFLQFVAFRSLFGQFPLFFFAVDQSNPVPGLCPCCKNPKNSDFLQSIHSEELFKMVQKLAIYFRHGKLGRKYLFCDQCIGWAKGEVKKIHEQSQQHGALQPSDHSQPHYSPVSDPEGSHSTPDPFNMQQYQTQESRIGARLANPNDSPIHLGTGIHTCYLHARVTKRLTNFHLTLFVCSSFPFVQQFYHTFYRPDHVLLNYWIQMHQPKFFRSHCQVHWNMKMPNYGTWIAILLVMLAIKQTKSHEKD